MNRLNLLEVYYDDYRAHGNASAASMFEKIKRTPITVIPEINDAVFFEVGRLKATYKISLADSIAAESAFLSGAELTTVDHHCYLSFQRRFIPPIFHVKFANFTLKLGM
jgi:hypothetical protein